MTAGGTKALPFIVGLLLGTLATHLVQLATYTGRYSAFAGSAAVANATGTNAATIGPKTAAAGPPPVQCPTLVAPPSNIDIPDQLYRRVRILCLIMTHPGNYDTKAVAVNNTWARRCNRYVFVGSNATKTNIPLMRLNLTDAYTVLWQKTWMSLDYAGRSFNLEDFDFVLKADDDTYVVMENLRALLLSVDPEQPSLLGRQFYYARDVRQMYMSGGAGYVLSRAAVRLFLREAVGQRARWNKTCDLDVRVSEDWMLGTCLASIGGVKLLSSRDSSGLERFHPLNPEYMIGWGPAEMPKWMWAINYYTFKACLHNCVSSVSATFHYISNMYLMEFLLYEMRPVGTDPTVKETGELMRKLGAAKR